MFKHELMAEVMSTGEKKLSHSLYLSTYLYTGIQSTVEQHRFRDADPRPHITFNLTTNSLLLILRWQMTR